MSRSGDWFFVSISIAVLCLLGYVVLRPVPAAVAAPEIALLTGTIRAARPTAPAHRIAQAIVTAGRRCEVDPLLIAAIVAVESGYRADAESVTGARGLMQLVRSTAEAEGLPWELAYDIELNTLTGACYLARHLKTHGGRIDRAASRYNGHDDPLFARKVLARYAGLSPSARTITVRRGDTLSRIADAYLGDPGAWRALAALNALPDPDRLEPGQVLVVRL